MSLLKNTIICITITAFVMTTSGCATVTKNSSHVNQAKSSSTASLDEEESATPINWKYVAIGAGVVIVGALAIALASYDGHTPGGDIAGNIARGT